MVRDINGLGGYASPKTSTEQGASKKTSAPDNTTISGSQAAPKTDDVQLSPEVKTLQALTEKVNSLPEINLERAEQIKAALQNGEYKIDDLVIAEKLLNSEALFGK